MASQADLVAARRQMQTRARSTRTDQAIASNRQSWILSTLTAASVLFLLFQIIPLGNYSVTVGGVLAAVVLLLSARKIRPSRTVLLAYGFFLFWPVLTFGGAQILNASLTPSPTEFISSYTLWAGTVTLIAAAVVSRSAPQLLAPHRVAYIILAVAILQVVMAGAFGNLEPFYALEGVLGANFETGYVRPVASWNVRAIGLYYEPSMCGLVLGTLVLMDVVRSRNFLRAGLMALATIILVKSLGLLVLFLIIGVILFSQSWRGFLLIAVLAVPVIIFEGANIAERLSVSANQTESSTIRRTVAPLATVGYTLQNYPLGLPIGASEAVAVETGYYRATGEPKITNGAYEFLMFFGVPGIIIVLSVLGAAAVTFASGRREMSALLAYVTLCTAISGSFLRIENALLIFYFVSTFLEADRRRMAGYALGPIRQQLPIPRAPVSRPSFQPTR